MWGSHEDLTGNCRDQPGSGSGRGKYYDDGRGGAGGDQDGFANLTQQQVIDNFNEAEYESHARLISSWLDANKFLDASVNGPENMDAVAAVELRSALMCVSNEHMAESVEYVFRFTPHSWSDTLVSCGQRVIMRALHQWIPTTAGLNWLIGRYPVLSDVRPALEKFRPRSVEVSGITAGRHFAPTTSAVRCVGNKVLLDRVSPTIDRLLPVIVDLVTTAAMIVASVRPAECFLKTETTSRLVNQVIVAHCAVSGGFKRVDKKEMNLPCCENIAVAVPEPSADDRKIYESALFYERMRSYFGEVCTVLNETLKLSEGALRAMGGRANSAQYKRVDIKNRIELIYYVALHLTLNSYKKSCHTFAITQDHAVVSRNINLMLTMINIRFNTLKLTDIWGHFQTRSQFDSVRGRPHYLTKCQVSDRVYFETPFITCHHLLVEDGASDDGIDIEPHEVIYRLIRNEVAECDLVVRKDDPPPKVGEVNEVKPLKSGAIVPTKVTPMAVHFLWSTFDQDPKKHDCETEITERIGKDSALLKMAKVPVVKRDT